VERLSACGGHIDNHDLNRGRAAEAAIIVGVLIIIKKVHNSALRTKRHTRRSTCVPQTELSFSFQRAHTKRKRSPIPGGRRRPKRAVHPTHSGKACRLPDEPANPPDEAGQADRRLLQPLLKAF